jgi:glyoxylase-like metal-dependent hydrolase (beta-lactamase superfamily II)
VCWSTRARSVRATPLSCKAGPACCSLTPGCRATNWPASRTISPIRVRPLWPASRHPHWDHLLWHALLGAAPRYGTARCAATVRDRLSDAGAKARVAELIPPDIVEQVPLDLLGLITGLPAETTQIPWDGPQVRIIEHLAHAPGHAALLIEERGVLVAGDMLSDVLIPLLDLNAADPIEDYLAALRLLEGVAGDVDVVVPGHGSVGGADQVHARIDQDRVRAHLA